MDSIYIFLMSTDMFAFSLYSQVSRSLLSVIYIGFLFFLSLGYLSFFPSVLLFLPPCPTLSFFWDRVSPCSYGWPGTLNVDQVGLKLLGFQSAGLKGMGHYTGPFIYHFKGRRMYFASWFQTVLSGWQCNTAWLMASIFLIMFFIVQTCFPPTKSTLSLW